MLPTIAVRNTWRHRTRTGMTIAAIATGVIALILVSGFLRDIFSQLAEAIIHSQSGHIQIVPSKLPATQSADAGKRMLPDLAEVRAIARVPGTRSVMARLTFEGLLNNGRTDMPIIGQGVEAGPERSLGSYMHILQGRNLIDSDHYGVLVGEGLAKAENLKPGDSVVLLASTQDGAVNTLDLVVLGVFRSFSREFDARAIRIPLRAAQELLGTQSANVVVIELNQTSQTDAIASELRSRFAGRGLDVRTWNALDDFYDKTVQLYRRQFAVLQVIVLLMILLSASNAVGMNVRERLAEFGTMRSLGDRPRRIIYLILLENAFTGVIGSLVGGCLGVAVAMLISAIGIPMPPPPNSNIAYTAAIRLAPLPIAGAMFIGIFATALASIAPAIRASRLAIVDSLRCAV